MKHVAAMLIALGRISIIPASARDFFTEDTPKLRRRRPKGGQLSLREVSKELAARGYLNERDKPYAAKSVASMLH